MSLTVVPVSKAYSVLNNSNVGSQFRIHSEHVWIYIYLFIYLERARLYIGGQAGPGPWPRPGALI
jgi:hypothetical protein